MFDSPYPVRFTVILLSLARLGFKIKTQTKDKQRYCIKVLISCRTKVVILHQRQGWVVYCKIRLVWFLLLMVLTYKGLQKLRACMTNSTWKWICVLFSVDSVAVTQWSPTPLSGVQILFGALKNKFWKTLLKFALVHNVKL